MLQKKMLSTTQVASEATRTNPTTEDQSTGKASNENRMSTTSKELYLDAVKEMYPEMNVHKLSSHLIFYKNWASVRASAALKAFTAVKTMITEKKLVYSNRTSYSDDDESDGSVASYVQKKPKKQNLDDEHKRFFTSILTCYLFLFCF